MKISTKYTITSDKMTISRLRWQVNFSYYFRSIMRLSKRIQFQCDFPVSSQLANTLEHFIRVNRKMHLNCYLLNWHGQQNLPFVKFLCLLQIKKKKKKRVNENYHDIFIKYTMNGFCYLICLHSINKKHHSVHSIFLSFF